MSTVDWASLSADEQKSLLLCSNRSVDLGVDLLDQSLNVVPGQVLLLEPGSGSVRWDAPTADQRDGVQTTATFTLVLASELSWGKDLIRLSKTVTDTDTGLSAVGYLGVFMLPFPDRTAGQTVRLDDGSTALAYQLSCQDRTAQLDRIPGRDWSADAGAGVVDSIKAALDAAGVTGYLLDGTKATSTVPTGGKSWPFAGGQQATWRTIINDLCDLIGYEPIWADSSGVLRVTYNTDPSLRSVAQALDIDTPGWVTPLGPQRTRKLDLSSVPNQWSILWVDDNGDPVTDASSPYEWTNQVQGAASVLALGGAPLGIRPAQQQKIQAASSADFLAQAKANIAAAMRQVAEYDVATVMWPELPHAPVFTYTDPDTTGTDDPVRVVASSAEIQLSDEDTTWTLQEVPS